MPHPTVEQLQLTTIESRYDGECAICRGKTAAGETIVQLNGLRPQLYSLGLLKVQSWNYCHITCLPTLLPNPGVFRPSIQAATEKMMAATDPQWPKDDIGFNAGDAGYAARWLRDGCPDLGLHEMARRLVKYIETQLGGADVAANKLITEAASYRAVVIRHEDIKPFQHSDKPKTSPQVKTVLLPGGLEVMVKAAKAEGEAHVCRNGQGLKVLLDPPWVNAQHAEIKDAIKAAGAKWDPNAKTWRCSAAQLVQAADAFQGKKISITSEAKAEVEKAMGRRALADAMDVTDQDLAAKLDAVGAAHQLFPFQKAAVEFIEKANGRALVSDEMGTGKSAESTSYLAIHPELRPAIVVVPAVVAPNWVREINMWSPADRVQRIKTGKDALDPEATMYVITYGLLNKKLAEIKARNPMAVVGDEIHMSKNPKAARTKAFVELAKHESVKSVLGLSGTPIINRPVEFFAILNLLRPNDFGSWWKYTQRFCNGHRTRWGYECSGASNTEELSSKLRDLMIRRKKEDVLKELPPKMRDKTPVELKPTQRRQYRKVVDQDFDNHLEGITAARQAAGIAKIPAAIEWIQTYQDQDKPLLVFGHHKAVLDALEDACGEADIRCGRIDGSVSNDRRSELVDSFQAGGLDVMLLSMKAAGVGITLTRAQDVMFVERAWEPGSEEQSEDRAHRIGTTGSVMVRYLVAQGTIDTDMDELIESKRSVLHAVLDGKATNQDLDIKAELIKRWAERKRK